MITAMTRAKREMFMMALLSAIKPSAIRTFQFASRREQRVSDPAFNKAGKGFRNRATYSCVAP